MNDRRRRHIEELPDGRLIDRDVERAYLASLARPRVTVERLSLRDAFCVDTEATSRERERAA